MAQTARRRPIRRSGLTTEDHGSVKVSCQSPSSAVSIAVVADWELAPLPDPAEDPPGRRATHGSIPSSCRRPSSGTDTTLTFETGKLAFQSQGSVVARLGKTEVLVTANGARNIREGIDFFPLTVDVEERMYAAGRIPGSFFRREGRPTDLAILTCRLIDRPLRPSFADGYRNETQVVVTVIGVDGENPYDVVAINGASAALMLSGLPFEGPIGAVRIAWSAEGKWVPHPTYTQGEDSTFELVVAGRQLDDGDIAIMMVEAGGTEQAWELYQDGTPYVTEEVIAGGLEAAKTWIRESIEAQRELVEQGRRPGLVHELEWEPQVDYTDEIAARVEAVGTDSLTKVAGITVKAEREAAQGEAAKAIIDTLLPEFPEQQREINNAAKALLKKIIRRRIVERGRPHRRPLAPPTSGRCRPRWACCPPLTARGCSSGARPRCSTSPRWACRRPTRSSTTWATATASATCTTTTCRPTPTARPAAWAAPSAARSATACWPSGRCCPWCPARTSSPTCCGSCPRCWRRTARRRWRRCARRRLSLMDAGVPIKAPVAGIAMGLVFAEGKYTTLTDILGAEDAFGDMDFKVAGTSDFVTALQLDTKIDGLPADVLAQALQQAYEARTSDPRGHARGHRRPRVTRWARPPRRSSASRSRWTRSAR